MKELFLIAALSLPSAMPYHANPGWTWGDAEVKVVKILRDWPNGYTGSRPSKWVLIYGRHPLWVYILREAKVKVIGMYHQHTHWPSYIVGVPYLSPFRNGQFQVYLYDDAVAHPETLAQEISRLVSPVGFFLYRYTQNGKFGRALEKHGWERFSLDFREFTIWWRPKNYTHIELTHSIIVRSA